LITILILSIDPITIFTQTYSLSGHVIDNKTEQKLSYAIIRVNNTGFGTAANELFKNPNWAGYDHDTLYMNGGYAVIHVESAPNAKVKLNAKAVYK